MTVTRYEYDDAGRVVRSTSVTESEWSREDVALLIASRIREASIGPHGIPFDEATDPANEHAFTVGRGPLVDFAEKAKRDGADAYYKKYDTKENPVNRNGHIWRVKRVSDV